MASGFATSGARSEVNSLRRVFRWVTAMGECDCECDSHYYEHSGASFSARTRGACRLAAQRLWRHYATFKEPKEKVTCGCWGAMGAAGDAVGGSWAALSASFGGMSVEMAVG